MIARLSPAAFALLIAAVLALLAIVTLNTAYSYGRLSGLFPQFVGWVFVGLTLIEVAGRFRDLMSRGVATPHVIEPTSGHAGVLREFGGVLWLGIFVTGIYVAGFVVAIPVFTFAFLRIAAGRPTIQCAGFAIAVTVLIHTVFAWLLAYRLYPGVFFGA